MTDLSNFYQHHLDYNEYVWLAYGVSGFILAILLFSIVLRHHRLKATLKSFKTL